METAAFFRSGQFDNFAISKLLEEKERRETPCFISGTASLRISREEPGQPAGAVAAVSLLQGGDYVAGEGACRAHHLRPGF